MECDFDKASERELRPKLQKSFSHMINASASNRLQPDGDQNSSPCALDSNTTRFCNDYETDIELDASEEMPPPLPYYNLNVQFVGPSGQTRNPYLSMLPALRTLWFPNDSTKACPILTVLARSTTPEFYAPSQCFNGERTTMTLY